ncbi:hypothetical protein [Gemmobacter caeruleus]|uniref:hypothetical protein n=1 Tax=Gemmobacter caeruleus TaxID=2595004 RepID=UPI0011ECDBA0|nr:hypothetical protein [Gemmobacter caeruleus]
MTKIATLSAAEIEQRVQEIGQPLVAPLVMPKQVLESAEPLSLRRAGRGLLARLHLAPARRQGM